MPKKNSEAIEPANSGNSGEITRLPNGQFAPGFSGNPDGPAPGYISLMKIIRRKLGEVYQYDEDRRSAAEIIADGIVQDAVRGHDIRETLLQYLDGKPVQPIVDLFPPEMGLSPLIAAKLDLANQIFKDNKLYGRIPRKSRKIKASRIRGDRGGAEASLPE